MDNLVGVVEIAERLGLRNTATVHHWRRRHADFPQPVAVVSSVFVWDWAEVKKWARKTGREVAKN